MNSMGRVLIEKAAYENGWERTLSANGASVVVASARHPANAEITLAGDEQYWVRVYSESVTTEIARVWPIDQRQRFRVESRTELARLLQRAAQLALALPPGAEVQYREQVEHLSEQGLGETEALRLTRQRIGQDVYRRALMDYWGGACAVTGIALPAALRASHARGWAECESDAQRLDVFNGFLLVANLDALFDQGLVSFLDNGTMICSEQLSRTELHALGLKMNAKLRWLANGHLAYLAWHRASRFLSKVLTLQPGTTTTHGPP